MIRHRGKIGYEMLAGKAINVLREIQHDEMYRTRVKTLDSFCKKLLKVDTTDLTHVQDIAGMMIVCANSADCYIQLHRFLKDGFRPYYKIWDTLENQCGYRSLDVNLKRDHLSFELQLRTEELQAKYDASHTTYKAVMWSEVREVFVLPRVEEQLEKIVTLADGDIDVLNHMSLFDLLVYASDYPREHAQWKDVVTTATSRSLFKQHGIAIPADFRDPRRSF